MEAPAVVEVVIHVEERAQRPVQSRFHVHSGELPRNVPVGLAPLGGDCVRVRIGPATSPEEVRRVTVSRGCAAPRVAETAAESLVAVRIARANGNASPGESVKVSILRTARGAVQLSAPAYPAVGAGRAAATNTEPRLDGAESAVTKRLMALVQERGMHGCVFKRVPESYYNETLAWRASVLMAEVPQLCKSIIMENTRLKVADSDQPDELQTNVGGRLKFVVVVVQYVRKLHKEKLAAAVRALEGDRAAGKSQVPWPKLHARRHRALAHAAVPFHAAVQHASRGGRRL